MLYVGGVVLRLEWNTLFLCNLSWCGNLTADGKITGSADDDEKAVHAVISSYHEFFSEAWPCR